MNSDSPTAQYTQILTKKDNRIKWRANTIKHLEENTEVNLLDFGLSVNDILDTTSQAHDTKGKQMNWASPELKPSVHQKEWKDNSRNGRKYF